MRHRALLATLAAAILVPTLRAVGGRPEPAPPSPSPHPVSPAARRAQNPLAPEFPSGVQWLNTDRPLRLKELRGKVVLLDFWTFG